MAKKKSVWRRFLNEGTLYSGASIVAKIEEPDYAKVPSWESVEASVRISDCDRNITLEFDSPSFNKKGDFPESLQNATYKITTLVSTLMEFNNELVAAYKRLETYKKPPKKKVRKKQ